MTWTKATVWSHDQHLKQDIRSSVEDPQDQAKSKAQERNQDGARNRKETKKKEWPDAASQWPDAGLDASGQFL